ncbi:BA14K family protein [Caulobacter soli]|uniref:BA14K family protein n=1 Tax=Caulobacter soli TaxID=2708539 RepID=UPI0013EDDBC8|nr:BA14K family protein [Caulobacter soli]
MSPAAVDDCGRLQGGDRRRCEDRRDRDRREHARRESERRKDAKNKGVVAGVVGTVIGAAVIGALIDGNKKNKQAEERRRYCLSRYGNYDPSTDSYRANDGRSYRCE